MLSFVRSDLPNGGSSSEERFFSLFPSLCTRIFGTMQDAKGEFQHEAGGWLSFQNRWRLPVSSSMQQQQMYGSSRAVAGSRAALSIDADPVVQLLGPSSKAPSSRTSGDRQSLEKEYNLRSLIEALTEEAENRPGIMYSFPFLALPAAAQEQFFLVLEAAVMSASQNPALGHPNMNVTKLHYNNQQQLHHHQNQPYMTHNSERLFGKLLRKRPEDQGQVRAYRQKKLQQKDQNQPMQLSPGMSPPPLTMAPISPSTPSTPTNQEKDASPSLILSMLEYYLFLFIRFPLACPTMQRPPQSAMPMNAYAYRGRSEPPFGHKVYINLFDRYIKHFLPHSNEFETELKQLGSEFFLRVIIAFWLEAQGSVPTTSKALRDINERFQRSGSQHAPKVNLNMSHELAFYSKYKQPPGMTQQCLRSLVIHLITDPALCRSVRETDSSRKTCLNPGMAALQQPFFNFIRTSLRHASIHSQGSVFYKAMNAWLIWLEPWNVQHGKLIRRFGTSDYCDCYH